MLMLGVDGYLEWQYLKLLVMLNLVFELFLTCNVTMLGGLEN